MCFEAFTCTSKSDLVAAGRFPAVRNFCVRNSRMKGVVCQWATPVWHGDLTADFVLFVSHSLTDGSFLHEAPGAALGDLRLLTALRWPDHFFCPQKKPPPLHSAGKLVPQQSRQQKILRLLVQNGFAVVIAYN